MATPVKALTLRGRTKRQITVKAAYSARDLELANDVIVFSFRATQRLDTFLLRFMTIRPKVDKMGKKKAYT